jgi:hypothetical protein
MLKVVKSIGIYCAVKSFMECVCADFAEHGLEMDCDYAYKRHADNAKKMFENIAALEVIIAERQGVYEGFFVRCDKDAEDGNKMAASIANLYLKKMKARREEAPFNDGVQEIFFKDFLDEASTLDREFEAEVKLVSGPK